MAVTKTLLQLREALKVAAGMNTTGTSVDLTPAVLNGFVNSAVWEGWDIIVNKWLDYFTTSYTLPMVAGTAAYAVPTNFYKLRLLEHADDETQLEPIALDAKGQFQGATGRPRRYLPMARQIRVYPTPSVAENLNLWYVPIQPELTADGDTITLDIPAELDLIIAIGWRHILDRQNLDPSPAIAKVDRYTALLRTAADGLDAKEPFYLNPNGPRADDDDWNDVI